MTRFLIDECLSPLIASGLRGRGIDAIHVHDLGLKSAPDEKVIDRAVQEDRVILTADNDFADLLARFGTAKPSVIFLRDDAPVAAAAIIDLVVKNLASVEVALREGAVVVVHATRIRVRRLPLFG